MRTRECKAAKGFKNIVEYWEQALMSKELATIILMRRLTMNFLMQSLVVDFHLYTEEAYLLCKRFEFKNILNRFTVEAPKNHAEKH